MMIKKGDGVLKLVKWVTFAVGVAAVVACSSSTDAKAPLGASCKSADECEDDDGTELRWCCDTATNGRAHVCRSTNCFGVK